MSRMPDTTTHGVTLLFVYGSLKPGHFNFYHVEPRVRGSQSASAKGVLLDLGAYPAMVEGDGIVTGVLLTVDESALAVTDRIEGYQPSGDSNLFVREQVEVQIENRDVIEAWVYRFANPERLADRPKLIVGYRDGRPISSWPPKDGDSLPNSAENESKS